MVIMASGVARGHVRTTAATVESHNMAAILQIMGWQRYVALVHCILLWYWTSMSWSTDTCQNKVSADQYDVTILRAQVNTSLRSSIFWSWPLTRCWFLIGSRAHVWLTCWKQGRTVRKLVDAHPGLNGKRIITFSSMQMFLLLCVYGDYWLKTEGQTIYRKPQCKVAKLKSKFYFFLG